MTESADSPPSASARKLVEEEGEDAKSIRRVGSVTGVPSCRASFFHDEGAGDSRFSSALVLVPNNLSVEKRTQNTRICIDPCLLRTTDW
eukprot:CAMPEP_0172604550 /NCGR_PEP_ID=MMETSP1068-20121228/24804_1 /TAXON_ID=35684 /ORGANISM="Pseudopedinella elastica, Strain CCMP716" /LENGTH=88 /DNA_ID=CAMNT_0013406659 /DNA_START=218 /DNA_END=481 /DNA_ORIENTATION=-